MKPFFTTEDFEKQKLWDAMMQTHLTNPYGVILSVIADIANAKLEREGKRVFGEKVKSHEECWLICDDTRVTHTALLIGIEEIEK